MTSLKAGEVHLYPVSGHSEAIVLCYCGDTNNTFCRERSKSQYRTLTSDLGARCFCNIQKHELK